MIEVLDSFDLYSKTLVVTADGDVNVIKSARNIPGVNQSGQTSSVFMIYLTTINWS